MDSLSLLTVQSGTEKYIFERLFSEHILKYNVDPTIRRSFLQIILDTRSNNLCYPFKHGLRCTSLGGVEFVFTKKRREKEAQRRSCLKGL